MLEPALVAYLKTEIGGVNGRVYPGHLPDPPELPALVYQRIATRRPVSYDGPSGFVRARVQLDIWSKSYGEARTIAGAVRRALLGYRGPMGGLEVAIPDQASDLDLFEPDTGLYRVSMDFIIWHEED